MASMMDLIQELWTLKRDIVSDDFDKALYRLAVEIPLKIHEYATGTPCWTWKIPEKWTCDEAYLETMDGRRLIDYQDHPLHVVSYSLSYEGEVTREELLNHLHTHARLPEAVPYVFKFYERDWGLCCSQALRDSLKDKSYRVVIRTRFEPGKLKLGEFVIEGESKQCFVIATHLCHPGMVNDDLTGVVVALDIARRLKESPKPHYTYRFLFLPETIGSVAFLSHHERLIPDMVGGLFLEMLGNDSPHALQQSFIPDSKPDKVFRTALTALDDGAYVGPWRSVINNDERQFNAPGVRVPMLSLSRVETPESATRPYREYHTNLDTPSIVTQERLEQSRDLVLALLYAWENDQYVINHFKGEVFCSGYGIWIDYRTNPEAHRRLFEIMERIDGEHTVADIAQELGVSFQAVHNVTAILYEKKLISYSRTPSPTTPKHRTVDINILPHI
jgi:aminopeptidase-like protein